MFSTYALWENPTKNPFCDKNAVKDGGLEIYHENFNGI